MSKFSTILLIIVFHFSTNACAADLPAHLESELKGHLAMLESRGIEATADGINRYFADLLENSTGLTEKEIDALIAQLGGSSFREREQATKRLAALENPPIARIKVATKSKDLEISIRARRVLEMLEGRQDPRIGVLRVVELQKPSIDLELLLKFIAKCDDASVVEQAIETFAAMVDGKVAGLVRNSAADPDEKVCAAAVRSWGRIEPDKSKLVAKLQAWLDDERPLVRTAAVRALLEAGKALNTEKFAKLLDPKTLAVVMRSEEIRLRDKYKDQRQDRETMKKYRVFLDRYAETLVKAKVVDRKKSAAANTRHWMDQGLDTSKHPEVVMYRIRWFNGQWSGWFMPGFNDRETGKGRHIRYWACFNDHEHEVVVATQKNFDRKIQDLP